MICRENKIENIHKKLNEILKYIYNSAGAIIPPKAATTGTTIVRTSLRLALISKPTKKKKIATKRSRNIG